MAINLDELRKKYEEINAKNAKTENKGGDQESKFLKLEDGANIIRILPAKEDGLPFFTQSLIHTVKGEGKSFKYWHCRKVHGEACPMCEAYFQIWNDHKKVCTLKDHKKCSVPYGKADDTIKPKERFYMNVVNRKDDTIRIASFPKTLFDKVMTVMLGDEKLQLAPKGDITDLKAGRDFNIVSMKKGNDNGTGHFITYDRSEVKDNLTPAGSSTKRITEYMAECHDLKAEVKLENYDEMKKAADNLVVTSAIRAETKVKASEVSDADYAAKIKG